LPLARADIRAELWVRRHASHAQASIAFDGGFAGGSSSSWRLHGEDEHRPVFERIIRDKPAAPWFVVAAVFDDKGKLKMRREAQILMPEREP
jgi:hypothetical protein